MARVLIAIAAVLLFGIAGFIFVSTSDEPTTLAPTAEVVSPAPATAEVDPQPPKPDFIPVKDRTLHSQIDRGSISLEKPNRKIIKAPAPELPKADETETPSP